jgi:hypothetical protein
MHMGRINLPPSPAFIKNIQVKETKPRPSPRYFEVKYGGLADELQEGFGAMQAIFPDYR